MPTHNGWVTIPRPSASTPTTDTYLTYERVRGFRNSSITICRPGAAALSGCAYSLYGGVKPSPPLASPSTPRILDTARAVVLCDPSQQTDCRSILSGWLCWLTPTGIVASASMPGRGSQKFSPTTYDV